MPDLSTLNQMGQSDFTETLGGIYECSPWVAQEAWKDRPFSDRSALEAALRVAVETAPLEKQRALILAHPDLGGRLGLSRDLTENSEKEQSQLGLNRLDESGYALFSKLNADYRARFGFPFIICVGLVDKAGILEAFQSRLRNGTEEEHRAALDQIHLIAGLRIRDLLR